MAKATGKKTPEVTRASQLRLDDRPEEYSFALEAQQSKVGAGASVAAHLVLLAIFLLIVRLAPQVLPPRASSKQLDVNDGVSCRFPAQVAAAVAAATRNRSLRARLKSRKRKIRFRFPRRSRPIRRQSSRRSRRRKSWWCLSSRWPRPR